MLARKLELTILLMEENINLRKVNSLQDINVAIRI